MPNKNNTNQTELKENDINEKKAIKEDAKKQQHKPTGQKIPENLPFAPGKEEKDLAAPKQISADENEQPALADSTIAGQENETAPPDINTAGQSLLEQVQPTTDDKDPSLPAELPDLKPDEIVEIEQPAPEEISLKDLNQAKELEAHNLPTRIILPASKKSASLAPREIPSPKTETELKEHHQKRLAELAEIKNKPEQGIPLEQKNYPLSDYLKKLTKFRLMANAKRRERKEKNLEMIMDYARRQNRITNNEVEQLIGVKNTQAYKYLKTLLKQGKIVKFGKTKNTFYKPIK